ncbi:MAG TPA: response regulator transcription factor [Chloroflexota bacterium]|nr:response regulator transcription factor [Chloroflexota bacterium]
MRALIIEGDPELADLLRRRLWREGHVVDVARNGEMGLHMAEGRSYDAVILDMILPDTDGEALTRRLRAGGIATPILILAMHATVSDRLRGLDAGADDYLTNPCALDEFSARLRAMTRRGDKPMLEDRLTIGDLILDRCTRIVKRGTRRLYLAPREFALLEYLMRHAGQVITRAVLLEHVWDYGFDPRANAVDAAIKRLRKAVDAGENRPLIQTVRGIGYTLQYDA